MTESEFQEFMITVGYRYNEKSKTAFNSFEGFRTMIQFGEKDSRYALTLRADAKKPEDTAAVRQQIEDFQREHKAYIVKAGFSDRCIIVTVKMTVDSDIDKDVLKELVHFMTELHKSGRLRPICGVCGREKQTGLYVVGRELVPMCDSCTSRRRRQYEKRRDLFEKKQQYMAAGIAGAVFGAVLGASIYILLYQLFPLFGTGSLLIAAGTFGGFVVAGERATRKSGIICAVIAFVVLLFAEYTAMVANMAILIERAGGGIAVSEAMNVINIGFADFSNLLPALIDVLIGSALIGVTGLLYFLKRKYTRPLKISKNIL